MEITKIEFKTSNGEEFELSEKEAREIYNKLAELFGKPAVIYVDRWVEPTYIPPPTYPIKPWNPVDPWITWGQGTDSAGIDWSS